MIHDLLLRHLAEAVPFAGLVGWGIWLMVRRPAQPAAPVAVPVPQPPPGWGAHNREVQ